MAAVTTRSGFDAEDPWLAIEACYARGWTDGLPVVPPTDALVDVMLATGPWAPDRVLLHEDAHAWRSLADLKRGGKVELAFFENPTLIDWLYRDRPGGPPDPLPSAVDAASVGPEDDSVRVHRGLGPDDILLAVGGGEAGGHSAFFPSWSRGRSVPFISKEVPS